MIGDRLRSRDGGRARGRFVKGDFVYLAEDDVYVWPTGEPLVYRYATRENGLTLHRYSTSVCQSCAIKDRHTPAKNAENRNIRPIGPHQAQNR
jgi:hypothetical protein